MKAFTLPLAYFCSPPTIYYLLEISLFEALFSRLATGERRSLIHFISVARFSEFATEKEEKRERALFK